MRALVALLLLACAQLAHACWPAQALGAGTMAQVKVVVDDDLPATGREAVALWWWCPGKYENRVRLLACAKDELATCLTEPVLSLSGVTDPAVLEQAWADNVQSFGAQREWIFGAFLRQAWHLKRPPPPVWTVPYVNTTTMSRPSYRVVDGVRSTAASGVRAPVGTTCDCARLHFEEGRSTYCPFSAVEPDLVALCRPVSAGQ